MNELAKFQRKLMEEMQEEPPEITRRVNENIWNLFDNNYEDPIEATITVKWSDQDDCFMALEHNRDASAFADSPADALRELATAIELYEEAQSDD